MVEWDKEIQHLLKKAVLLIRDHQEVLSYNSTLNYRSSYPSCFKGRDQLLEVEFLFFPRSPPTTSRMNYQTTPGLMAPTLVHIWPPGATPGGQAAPIEPNTDPWRASVQN